MKRSKCYRLAQMAVLNDSAMLPSEKLEILRALMAEETVWRHCEETANEKENSKESSKESEVEPY